MGSGVRDVVGLWCFERVYSEDQVPMAAWGSALATLHQDANPRLAARYGQMLGRPRIEGLPSAFCL
jgi:hypothetical protein